MFLSSWTRSSWDLYSDLLSSLKYFRSSSRTLLSRSQSKIMAFMLAFDYFSFKISVSTTLTFSIQLVTSARTLSQSFKHMSYSAYKFFIFTCSEANQLSNRVMSSFRNPIQATFLFLVTFALSYALDSSALSEAFSAAI